LSLSDYDIGTMGIFRTNEYLSDPECQKIVAKAADSWEGKKAFVGLVSRTTSIAQEDLKNQKNADLYFVLSIAGTLIRTHMVIKEGIKGLNPPPDDYLCDSCHRKGWLNLGYQESKLDGASIPVWLCLECEKLEPKERDVRF